MEQLKPSEVIENFLSYIEAVKSEYEENFAIVGEEDKRLQDFSMRLNLRQISRNEIRLLRSFNRAEKGVGKPKKRCWNWKRFTSFRKTRQTDRF